MAKSTDAELVETYSSVLRDSIEARDWLTFALTAREVAMPPLMVAHAEHIGYKRSKKIGEMPRPNQLFHDRRALNTDDVDPEYERIQDFLQKKIAW
jgi:hypothetical protein